MMTKPQLLTVVVVVGKSFLTLVTWMRNIGREYCLFYAPKPLYSRKRSGMEKVL